MSMLTANDTYEVEWRAITSDEGTISDIDPIVVKFETRTMRLSKIRVCIHIFSIMGGWIIEGKVNLVEALMITRSV